ncbi:hypothetical protein H310_02185 [Aphanomyces invadans]|uniref:Uncharacterized protein n=1 Tax=Aphanomyces invadans TaxID=157072 RepID=A0A024UQ16_9STRA|nr:hypothetical protein H310_02185 [Aphanomyces invadans]ETW07743.1 hypothetical protein H310_02185 [Aphanomyces invadans]|eukprot:XP_008863836.1 hypothetical protein H310_02185 [Aphanomyces invadans]
MDRRDEGEARASESVMDGSQTERTRGTFGGRQRWLLSGSSNIDCSSVSSPKKSTSKSKVTAPSVQSFLGSLGIGLGEELQMVDKEANEVAAYRREYDTIRSNNMKKELEVKKLQESLQEVTSLLSSRKVDGVTIQSKAMNLENRSSSIENKLEEETADKGVYMHMIQRLTVEVQAGKKQSSHKEKELQSLEIDLTAGNATLQAARQEKCAAEALHKKLAKTLMDTREENARALEDLHVAIDTTRKKYELHEQRESSRRKIAQNVTGEQSAREMKRLRQESQTQAIQFTQIQNELMTTDAKLLTLEADLRRLSEAAGTNDIDKIIAKYLSREETLRNLKEEHAITDAKMRKLRDNYKQLQEQLATLRGATMNTRGIYQEMDDTAEKLKDIEKNASALQERCNRANVLLDAFRSCMIKCMAKLSTVRGSLEIDADVDFHRANETSTTELVHLVEQKLGRILDVINREKAEHELHRSEAMNASHTGMAGGDDKRNNSLAQPSPSETEEHFILRVSTADNSQGNIRVRPKSQPKGSKVAKILRHNSQRDSLSISPTKDKVSRDEDDAMAPAMASSTVAAEDDPIIDRTMRKKLVGLVLNRGKRVKKGTTNNEKV